MKLTTVVKKLILECGQCILKTLQSWLSGCWKDLTGPSGYRVIAVVAAAYIGLYSILEARYVHQTNTASTARDRLITMGSSGHRHAFTAAMNSFGPVQTMSVPKEPSLFAPQDWFETTTPNVRPLHLWAIHRLRNCKSEECGVPKRKNFREYKISLHWANLSWAKLSDVDISDSSLLHSDLSHSDLTCSDLHNSYLRGVNLSDSILHEAVLVNVDLSCAKSFPNHTGNKERRCADLRRADLTKANLSNADLMGANLRHSDLTYADLRGVKNLKCSQLTEATNWHLSCRDSTITCGRKSQPNSKCSHRTPPASNGASSLCKAPDEN